MSDQLPPEVRELLAAVVEALDVPLPDITDAAERAHYRVLQRRATDTRVVLATLLEFNGPDLAQDSAVIRQRTAEAPVDYPLWEPPRPAAEGYSLTGTPGGDQAFSRHREEGSALVRPLDGDQQASPPAYSPLASEATVDAALYGPWDNEEGDQ